MSTDDREHPAEPSKPAHPAEPMIIEGVDFPPELRLEFEFAKLSIQARMADKENERLHKRKTYWLVAGVGVIFFCAIVSVIVTALILKEATMAERISLALITAVLSGLGGYGIGRVHKGDGV